MTAIKAAIAATQELIAAIAAGGWVVLVVVLLICMIGLLIASPFGIFFADRNSPDSVSPTAAIVQINGEYADTLSALQAGGTYDRVEIQGRPPSWADVFAVFAAKAAGGADGAQVSVLDPDTVEKLRDKSLSLKAKGLLSLMLSLPETWDYTLAGLARISLEGKDAIRAAVVELEKAGCIHRSQTTDKAGKFSSNEYIIREYPASHEPSEAKGRKRSRSSGMIQGEMDAYRELIRENTTQVRNMKQYLLTVLYNAPATIENHYAAQVNHNLYGGEAA